MDSNEGVLVTVTDDKVGTAITTNCDLLPSASTSFFLTRNDITVGASGHACIQGDIQVPGMENKHQPKLYFLLLVSVLHTI